MRTLILPLLCFMLAGCASLQATHVQERNSVAFEKMATDAAHHLAKLYPPAKTQFSLMVSDPKDFGELLEAKLRARGYAVSESVKTKKAFSLEAFTDGFQPDRSTDPQEAKIPGMNTPGAAAEGIELSYALDTPSSSMLHSITLKVGEATLSRAYLTDSRGVAAAGAWTYREE